MAAPDYSLNSFLLLLTSASAIAEEQKRNTAMPESRTLLLPVLSKASFNPDNNQADKSIRIDLYVFKAVRTLNAIVICRVMVL